MTNNPYFSAALFMIIALIARLFIAGIGKEMGNGKFILESLLEFLIFMTISYFLDLGYAGSIRLFVAGSALITILWLVYYRYKKRNA